MGYTVETTARTVICHCQEVPSRVHGKSVVFGCHMSCMYRAKHDMAFGTGGQINKKIFQRTPHSVLTGYKIAKLLWS